MAIGTGVGAGGSSGALTTTSFSVGGTSTSLQRLVWDANQIQLDLSTPVALSSHALEVIGLNGVAALQLNFKQATSASLPGGGQAWRWRACTAPAWKAGDQLMLRLSPVASAFAAASGPLGCGPAPTFGAASYAFKAAENAAVGATVGQVKATGQGKDAVSYTLTAGNTGGAFAVNAKTGAITVAKALDYETTASYSLTVQGRATHQRRRHGPRHHHRDRRSRAATASATVEPAAGTDGEVEGEGLSGRQGRATR